MLFRSEDLVREEALSQAQAEGLAVEAQQVAGRLAAMPRLSASGRAAPQDGMDALEEWGARAHAALFVVRGGLDGERERLVHEANGLAASLLGDQGAGASVALVRRQLERSLGRG